MLDVAQSYQVIPLPEISQLVEVNFNAVPTPFCAMERVPDEVEFANVNVSLVIAMLNTCDVWLTNVSVVPSG